MNGASTAAGDALRALALQALADARRGLARRGSHRHNGVHDARKALRRLRSALALLREAAGIDIDNLRLLDAAVRDANRSLSALRDAHALVETIDRLRRRPPFRGARLGLSTLRTRLVADRAAALARAERDDPGGERLRARLGDLEAAVASLPWPLLDQRAVERALARTHRRLRRAMRAAVDTDDAVRRHAWRRRARRLRQQLQLLEQAGSETAPRVPGLRALVDALGEENDVAVLVAWLATHAPCGDAALLDALSDALRRARVRSDRRAAKLDPDALPRHRRR